ncbi:TPA: hypothetical protein ACLG1R_002684 [Pseudomonas aeruginosa]
MNMVTNKQKALGQFPTPAWVADALYRQHFSHLGANDLVLEPGCGPGRFLQVIPPHVPAIGIDIDPDMVERARADRPQGAPRRLHQDRPGFPANRCDRESSISNEAG